MSDTFIGRGVAFPLRLDSLNRVALVGNEQEIEEAIWLILGTAYGERPMRPDFGCGIHDYVFAEADGTTAGLISYEVRASLQRWEPRIDVVTVRTTIDDREPGRLLIEVSYRIRGANDPRNLVFPFYVIPGE